MGDDALGAGPNGFGVKVENETEPLAGQSQIGEQLRGMNRSELRDRLDLDDEQIFDQ